MSAGTAEGLELPTWQARQLRRTSCRACGASPARPYVNGPLCTAHAPALPGGTYCAPARCYCPGDKCERPAS
jgi:hypothetical protein